MIQSEDFWGGSQVINVSGATQITYGGRRKVRAINPTVSNPTVTLPAANTPTTKELGARQVGSKVLILFNASGTNAFTLVDAEATFSKSIAVGKGCYVHRFWNGSAYRFAADVRNILT